MLQPLTLQLSFISTMKHMMKHDVQHHVMGQDPNHNGVHGTDHSHKAVAGIGRYIDSRAENGLTALHLAAIAGSLPCVQALLAAGANMMMQTIDQGMNSIVSIAAGSSVLHAAVDSHQVAIVQTVLQVSQGWLNGSTQVAPPFLPPSLSGCSVAPCLYCTIWLHFCHVFRLKP